MLPAGLRLVVLWVVLLLLPRFNPYETINIHCDYFEVAGNICTPLLYDYMIAVSHLLLAINSATNIVSYTSLSYQFRMECRKMGCYLLG